MYKRISTLSVAALMLLGQMAVMPAMAQTTATSAAKNSGIEAIRVSRAVPRAAATVAHPQSDAEATAIPQGSLGSKNKLAPMLRNNTIVENSKPSPRRLAPRKEAQEATLWESFEDFDAEAETGWLPDGWTRHRTSDDADIAGAWIVDEADEPEAADGYCYAGINYSKTEKDEWLITPEVTVAENQVLSFYVYFSPTYMFNLDEENIDWDNYEFINKVKSAAMDVRVQVDGGEWTVIKDFFEDYKDMSLLDLAYAEMQAMTKVTLPLTDYVGKTVRFAFCYQGKDGDTWYLDAVSVDMPKLEADYMTPTNEQYFGFGCNAEFGYCEANMAIFPAYSNIVWSNTTDDESATYSWTYDDPGSKSGASAVATDDELTLAYATDYDSDEASRQNLFAPPTLTATAPGAADGSYVEPISKFKVGGKPECLDDEGAYATYGMLPFNLITDGISYFTAESPDGETADVPVFGYSDQTVNYWTDRTFSGDTEEGDRSEVMGYMNYIVPGDKPMVVEQVWTNALGKLSDEAELKASFYALNSANEVPDEPFVTATCKGSEVLKTEGYTYDYLTVPFTFDSPVVLEATDDTPGYLVEISGFNNGGVTYYAPIQSYYPNKDGKNLGWLNLKIHWAGADNRSISRLSNFENENGALFCSFAINLGGYYPWLHSDVEETTIDDGQTVAVALDSYYEGSKLSVACADGSELPSWLNAEVSGQYDKTTLTLTATSTGKSATADLVVTAPGVKAALKVNKISTTGISAASGEATATVKSVYSVSGQQQCGNAAPAGLYIEIDSNGHARKVVR